MKYNKDLVLFLTANLRKLYKDVDITYFYRIDLFKNSVEINLAYTNLPEDLH